MKAYSVVETYFGFNDKEPKNVTVNEAFSSEEEANSFIVKDSALNKTTHYKIKSIYVDGGFSREEVDRQITIETNKTHSAWAAGWLYKGNKYGPCPCAYCRK